MDPMQSILIQLYSFALDCICTLPICPRLDCGTSIKLASAPEANRSKARLSSLVTPDHGRTPLQGTLPSQHFEELQLVSSCLEVRRLAPAKSMTFKKTVENQVHRSSGLPGTLRERACHKGQETKVVGSQAELCFHHLYP